MSLYDCQKLNSNVGLINDTVGHQTIVCFFYQLGGFCSLTDTHCVRLLPLSICRL